MQERRGRGGGRGKEQKHRQAHEGIQKATSSPLFTPWEIPQGDQAQDRPLVGLHTETLQLCASFLSLLSIPTPPPPP